MQKIFKLGLIAFALYTTNVYGQIELSFEDALSKALEHNYDIRQAKISTSISENNASKANNGYLPSIQSNAGYNWTYYQGNNELKTTNVEYDPNNSFSYNASATIQYTLYDGGTRKYSYEQAKENQILSELQLRQIVENTTVQMSAAYYELVRSGEETELLLERIALSKNRLLRAQYAFEYGQGSQLDILNAKVDLNLDSVNYLTAVQNMENASINLNLLMGQGLEQKYKLTKEVRIRRNIGKNELIEGIQKNNVQYLSASHTLRNSEYAIRSSKGALMPKVAASTGFQYRGSNDPNGAFVIGSNSYGPNAGLSLTWSLWNPQANVQIQNAQLLLENQKIAKSSVEQNILSQALNAYSVYQNQLFILQTQSDNLASAQLALDRSKEALKLGQVSSLEFRQVQLNLFNAQLGLSQSKYNAKNAEMQLLAFMGMLSE